MSAHGNVLKRVGVILKVEVVVVRHRVGLRLGPQNLGVEASDRVIVPLLVQPLAHQAPDGVRSPTRRVAALSMVCTLPLGFTIHVEDGAIAAAGPGPRRTWTRI